MLGGCIIVGFSLFLKIFNCSFVNNLVNVLVIFYNVKNVEILDLLFVGNFFLSGLFGGVFVILDYMKCKLE